MSLASDLLYNTSKRRQAQNDMKEAAESAPATWAGLNSLVYSLIDKHEPDPKLETALKTDMRVMQLSGLINELSPCATRKVCKEASDVMAELLRMLPKTR
jgi:hypothetical protein